MILRRMRVEELGRVLDWAAAEGWNPGLDDVAAFHAADPEGFFVAALDDDIVAAISVVNHDPRMAFLGLYLCLAEYRGQGIGIALWQHALTHSGPRCVGLDGVAAQQANYAKSGFVAWGDTTRWQGRLVGSEQLWVRRAGPADLGDLLRLDRRATGYDRRKFLTAWLAGTATRCTVLHRGPLGTDGFATIRLCRNGAKIGPVVAPDLATGMRLIRAASLEIPAETLAMDLPQDRADLAGALSGAGFEPVFRAARMYRGTPATGNGTIVAIATMELG